MHMVRRQIYFKYGAFLVIAIEAAMLMIVWQYRSPDVDAHLIFGKAL